jgi:hypothetical protein
MPDHPGHPVANTGPAQKRMAPTRASPDVRRRSSEPRRVHHSARLDEPARKAAIWLCANDPGPGCLSGQRQCGQWRPEIPGEYLRNLRGKCVNEDLEKDE